MSTSKLGRALCGAAAMVAVAALTAACSGGSSTSRFIGPKTGAQLHPGYEYTTIGSAPKFDDGIPAVPREYRAAWVATVANIDWPSRPGLSTQEQQDEAIAILDALDSLNMNAVIFQARPQKDAFYPSDLEPWSYFLTGAQGQAPDPFYDPLEFWVTESHNRGMELHVWFNPYRAQHTSFRGDRTQTEPRSVVDTKSDITYRLANGMYWMDPAARETQDHSINVVMDVVRRYNVDGIHFDDYFYPYDSYNDGADFPDDATWAAYQAAGGELSRSDWRRKAVDDFMERLYHEIKAEKPHVKFGLSPFGIWRPGYPASIEGFDQYEGLYADAKKWLNEGWVDYYTPQLYWPTRLVPQSYPVLLEWWQQQNYRNRHLWPGIATFHVRGEPTNARIHRSANELVGEIMISRAIAPEGPGQTHFSMRSLTNDEDNLMETLRNGPYSRKALIPASPWLDPVPPAAPSVDHRVSSNNHVLTLSPGDDKDLLNYVVYKEAGGSWTFEIVPAVNDTVVVSSTGEVTAVQTGSQGLDVTTTTEGRPVTRIAVSAIDRVGNESKRTIIPVR